MGAFVVLFDQAALHGVVQCFARHVDECVGLLSWIKHRPGVVPNAPAIVPLGDGFAFDVGQHSTIGNSAGQLCNLGGCECRSVHRSTKYTSTSAE